MSKLWGGRFEKATDREVEAYTSSLSVDSRLWQADIRGSIAHAKMLGDTGVLEREQASRIVGGLEAVAEDIGSGKSRFDPEAEDVHSEIERLLSEKVGPLAGMLHTARSRNDQVATATRLYARDGILELQENLKALQRWLVQASESHLETLLPGMTHLQHAQPVSLAHHLMAYFWMFQRDRERLSGCLSRVNRLPLGSAALAGTTFPIDRQAVARHLAFDGVCENSLDAVSDRDFVVEFLSAASVVMTHLSRLSEELIVWSTPEFGYVELDDAVTTGSSIMPQKKNPDVAELIRGRAGRVTGALVGALTLLKGLPLSYNRDLQEDKGFLFEGLDVTSSSVRIMKVMLENARFDAERMQERLHRDFSNATDLADHLVSRGQGVTFRQAHEVVGRIVRHCLERGLALEELSLAELQAFSPAFSFEALECIRPLNVLRARKSEGGTAPSAVLQQLERARQLLD